MLTNLTPIITCHLTNEAGNVISCPNQAVRYVTLCLQESPCHTSTALSPNKKANTDQMAVRIEGFVTLFENEKRLSHAIPFRIVKHFCIQAPKQSAVKFVTRQIHCDAQPVFTEKRETPAQVNLSVHIDWLAESRTKTGPGVPDTDGSCHTTRQEIACMNRVVDTVTFQSTIRFLYKPQPLNVKNFLYGAIGDGKKRVFTSNDSLPNYQSSPILSADRVSYLNLFINSVLQPKSSYKIVDGCLKFETRDVPGKGELVVIAYVRLSDCCDRRIPVENALYFAKGDGRKRIFTNADALKGYGSSSIPAPNEVSCCNLFINGVLQPRTNYTVHQGILKLTTMNSPQKGQIITLEMIKIKDRCGHPYWMECSQYNTFSNGGRIYTDRDGLKKYGSTDIVCPSERMFQALYVNGMIQPKVNYRVRQRLLALDTNDLPPKKEPITLQMYTAYY